MADASAPPSRPGQRDLTVGPIGRSMLVFALPVLGTSVVQTLNASINAYWVGNLIGERGIAATTNANNILFLLLAAVFGVGLASTILIGQAMGRRDLAQAKQVVGTTATFFLGMSTLMAIVGYLASDWVLVRMNTPSDVLPLASAYLRVIFVALPFLYFNTFLSMALRGTGDSRTPFIFSIVGTGIDVGLNPVLIHGWGPIPSMGIAGSSTATLIGQVVALVSVLVFAYARRFPIRLTRADLHLLRPDRRLLTATIVKGVPMGLQMVVVSASGFAMIDLVNLYGTTATAAYGVAAQMWNYVFMPAMAVGAASSSFAAQNIGAKKWDRVEQTARTGVLMNLALTGALVLAVYAAQHWLVARFLPHDAHAWPMVFHINAIGLWGYLFLGVGFVLFAVVRAAGAVVAPLVVLTIALLVFRIPAALLLRPALGVDAVFWTAPVSMMIAMVLAAAYHRFGNWRQAHLFSDEPAAGSSPPSVMPSGAGPVSATPTPASA